MAWNVFKFCTGLKVVGSVMIVVVLAVVGVSYYAVVISIYAPQVIKGGSEAAVALIVVILFHALLLMLLWCYFTVVFTDPGSVPQNWRPSPIEDLEDQTTALASTITPATGLNMPTVPQGPLVRYCRKCSQFKPPRCHHCSVCFWYCIALVALCSHVLVHWTGGRCVLKMDHHCVWVVNCVGARNYKFFLLFLRDCPTYVGRMMQLYTFLETTLVTAALLPLFIAFLSDVEEEAVHPGTLATMFLAFVLNLAFALSVLGFLIMHMSLVAGNTTTIEAYEKKASTRWRFDLGHKKNFEQVFGTRKLYWVLPMYTQEDQKKMTVLHGLDYPLRPDLES